MHRIIGLLLLGLLGPMTGYGQLLSQEQLKKEKAFVSLEQALKTPKKVIKLDLWSAHLQKFPPEIFQFTNLQVLNLNFNQLKALPNQLHQLQYLQVLRLGHNQLVRFPEHLAKLPHLRILDLHGNQLQRIPDTIGHLKQLEELYLHENQLIAIHSNWQHLTQLRFFNLSENQLSSLAIHPRHALNKLKMLILVENKFNQGERLKLQQLLRKTEVRF